MNVYFSEQHASNGDESVQQVLVFSSAEAYNSYVERSQGQTIHVPLDQTGASMRLRAVMNDEFDDAYRPIVRGIRKDKFARIFPEKKSFCARTILKDLKAIAPELLSELQHQRYQ